MDLDSFCTGKRMKGIHLGNASVAVITGAIAIAVLPYYVYRIGAEAAWTYAGIFIFLQVAWGMLSYRMMRYARKSGGAVLTVPSYFTDRFRCGGAVHYVIAALFSVISLIVTAFMLRIAGNVMTVFGVGDATRCIIIIAALGIGINILRGFTFTAKASVLLNIILIIELAGLVAYAGITMGLGTIVRNTIWSDIDGSVSDYINILVHDGKTIYPEEIIRLLSDGLCVFGMPPLLSIFLAEPSAKAVKKSRRVTAIVSILLFVESSFLGGVSRAFLFPKDTERNIEGYIYAMFNTLMNGGVLRQLLGIGYLAAVFITLLIMIALVINITSGLIAADIVVWAALKRVRDEEKKLKRKKLIVVIVTILTGLFTAFLACGMRLDISELLIFLLRLTGVITGPAAFMSVYWKRMNKAGLVAGMILGPAGLILAERYTFFGLGAVIPGVALSFIGIIAVSLATKKPDGEMMEKFEEVKNRIV